MLTHARTVCYVTHSVVVSCCEFAHGKNDETVSHTSEICVLSSFAMLRFEIHYFKTDIL